MGIFTPSVLPQRVDYGAALGTGLQAFQQMRAQRQEQAYKDEQLALAKKKLEAEQRKDAVEQSLALGKAGVTTDPGRVSLSLSPDFTVPTPASPFAATLARAREHLQGGPQLAAAAPPAGDEVTEIPEGETLPAGDIALEGFTVQPKREPALPRLLSALQVDDRRNRVFDGSLGLYHAPEGTLAEQEKRREQERAVEASLPDFIRVYGDTPQAREMARAAVAGKAAPGWEPQTKAEVDADNERKFQEALAVARARGDIDFENWLRRQGAEAEKPSLSAGQAMEAVRSAGLFRVPGYEWLGNGIKSDPNDILLAAEILRYGGGAASVPKSREEAVALLGALKRRARAGGAAEETPAATTETTSYSRTQRR